MPPGLESLPENLDASLARLETVSRALDTPPESYAEWLKASSRFAESFLRALPEAPAVLAGERPVWLREAVPMLPSRFESVLTEFERAVLTSGVNPASGRFLGYVSGGGVPTAALGDFLAALTNRYAGVYAPSPGPVEIENVVLTWLRDMVGFPREGWGTLQSGGSLATLTAVVAARTTRPWNAWAKGAIYLTEESHHCIQKALRLAGLDCVSLRVIPVDEEYRLSVPELEKRLDEDKRQGLVPWMLFASAGTVNTGAVDPLEPLAEIARRERMWFHVDAAYGGFFVATAPGREILKGMRLADSLVLDPHKGLFMPYGLGAVLVRDPTLLERSLRDTPDYLADARDPSERSPTDYSPELTRHFRALRLWLSLKVHGLERFQAALEEKWWLARFAYDRLSQSPGLEMGPYPQLSCLTVRKREGDEATALWLARILERGRIHLSSTRLKGSLFLRLCVLSFRTHRTEVETVVRELSETAS